MKFAFFMCGYLGGVASLTGVGAIMMGEINPILLPLPLLGAFNSACAIKLYADCLK